jgi:TolB-like protein/DNA-binding winged helix-turn-helix (wHTH) protein/Tfp pilus assembly protein PilF
MVRFGPFEADLAAGEVRKSGVKLRLTGQPFEILAMLLARPGEVVTREDLRRKLWPGDTFVDYEHSVNAAINKLRDALSDSADSPVYVETLPRRGYRFIAPVSPAAAPPAASAEPLLRPVVSGATENAAARTSARTWRIGAVLVVAAALIGLAFLAAGRRRAATSPASPAVTGVRGLAVLPFETLSRDPAQDYFADGITEELISRLSQIRSLRVVSRTSVMQYRGARQPLPEIARRLSVDAIVEGTVQREGDRVAIFASLVNAATDRTLWSGRYEGDLRDVLGLQSQVAAAIAEEIRAHSTEEERHRIERARPVDPDAYAAYLKGRYYQEKWQPWSTQRAIEQFRESLERDPGFAPAWVRMAEAELFSDPPRERMARAKAAVLRGLELDPMLSEAHVVLGLTLTFWDWDWEGAEKAFRRAIELDPALSDAHFRYAHLLAALGRFDEAIAECRRALELDPLSSPAGHYLGRIYYFARRYDDAIAQLRKTLELDRNDYWSNLFLGIVYAHAGRPELAQPYLERSAMLAGMPFDAIAAVQQAYRRGGHAAALRKKLELETKFAGDKPLSSSSQALSYAQLGDREQALAWLQKAFDAHPRDLIYIAVDPSYDSIREDPRFQTIALQVRGKS